MSTSWFSHSSEAVEWLLGAPYGSTQFWIALGIAGGALLLFGWLIANFIFQAKRGIIVTLLAQLIPAAAGLAAWSALHIHVVPELSAGPLRDYLPIGASLLAVFLATVLVTRFLLGISEMAALFSVVFSYACVAGAVYAGRTLVDSVDTGQQRIEQHRQEQGNQFEDLLGN